MQKVLVIGCPSSGKSTFSRALAQKTGLPLCHLDLLYWNADKTVVPKDVFHARLQTVLDTDAFIIDGNFSSTMELRLTRADTVFFLDYPTEVCIAGLEARKGKPRSDLPWQEDPHRIDEEFLAFVKSYYVTRRPAVLALLQKYENKDVHIFRSRTEADAYLSML